MAFEAERARMIEAQLRARGISSERVLRAFARVPRHLFVPSELQAQAYEDHPLAIGEGQTISQPYIVALMIQWLRLQGHERVLELGTGSGYQLALLAELALEVYSIERLPDLAALARWRLGQLGYQNIQISAGNGTLGWPEHAPYDCIIVSAGAPRIPEPLLTQLGAEGCLIIPVGNESSQLLTGVRKRGQKIEKEALAPCVFVPMIGAYGWPPEDS